MADKKRRELGITQRMNSCIKAPQEEILDALNDENLRLFIDILTEEDLNVNHEYAEQEGSTLLFICVSAGKVDFVKEILRRRDVDPNQPHQMLKKTPLHVAGKFTVSTWYLHTCFIWLICHFIVS